MRSLDDVIKGMEMCYGTGPNRSCEQCPYREGETIVRCRGLKLERDALHYLNVLRDDRDQLADLRQKHLEAIIVFMDELNKIRGQDPGTRDQGSDDGRTEDDRC